jgi:3-hydroxypropanoate dehydrogenase
VNAALDKDKIDLAAQESVREARKNSKPLDASALDMLFNANRSFNGWKNEHIGDEKLKEIYDLMKQCPTANNCCPLRIKFVRSEEGKKNLAPLVMERNRRKTLQAPVTAILGFDYDFYQHFITLTPHRPTEVKKRMEQNPELVSWWANMNGALQGAYFIMSVRAVGLDVGPMQGIDKSGCDALYWAGTKVKTAFIVSLGRGDESTIYKKLPRFAFEEVCELL